jgi:hypothetical protein
MGVAVATCTGWEFGIRETMQGRFAVHTLGMLGERFGMTVSAVHRIESAPMPPLPANVTIETRRIAVWGAPEKSQIYFMAVVTLAGLLSVGCQRNEQRAENHQGEEYAHCSHHGIS